MLFVVSVVLFVLAFIFPHDSYVDRENYIGYYDIVSSGGFVFVEPAFYVISYTSRVIAGSPALVFPIFAVLGVLLKIYVLKRVTPNVYLSILVYLSYFYLLHDNAQVRIGAAMTFILLAFYLYYHLFISIRYYLFFVFVAMNFHLSVFIFLFIPMLISRRFGYHVLFVFMCMLISMVIVILHLSGYSMLQLALSNISYSHVESEKIEAYVANAQGVGVYNAFVKLLPVYFVLLIYVIFPKKINYYFPQASVYARLLCFGALFFSLLAPLQIVAYRVFDLFYFFAIVFVPAVSFCFSSALARFLFVFFFSTIYFVYVHFVIDFSPI